jgi:hypothetical protein
MGRLIRPRSIATSDADFSRLHLLLANKYGEGKLHTNKVTRLPELKRTKTRMDDEVTTCERTLDDLKTERKRVESVTRKKFAKWNDTNDRVVSELKPYDRRIQGAEDNLKEAKRQQDDMEIEIREEEYREEDGTLPMQTTAKWFKPGVYDVELCMYTAQNNVYLWVAYNGFVSSNLDAIPSDL